MNINTRDLSFVNFNNEEMQWVKFNGVIVYEAWKNLIASGVPPLTLLNCKGVDLVDYKIYGNEGVGDKTKNLFNINNYPNATNNSIRYTISANSSSFSTGLTLQKFAPSLEVGKTYTISYKNEVYQNGVLVENKTASIYFNSFDASNIWKSGTSKTLTQQNLEAVIRIGTSKLNNLDRTVVIYDIQIEEGEIATEYEQYGYKTQVKVSNGTEEITTNIYLDEPLTINDYIHYKKQELSKNGVSTTIELPNIPTFKGTTTLSVDTTIQPSNLEVVYKGK